MSSLQFIIASQTTLSFHLFWGHHVYFQVNNTQRLLLPVNYEHDKWLDSKLSLWDYSLVSFFTAPLCFHYRQYFSFSIKSSKRSCILFCIVLNDIFQRSDWRPETKMCLLCKLNLQFNNLDSALELSAKKVHPTPTLIRKWITQSLHHIHSKIT